jgi:hypothetical protein
VPKNERIKAGTAPERHTPAPTSRTLELLDSFPIFQRVLELAVAHEEKGLRSPGYMGWRWHDVEVHPTRLIRLVTSGVSRISLRTRQATYYLLKDRAEIKRALENRPVESSSENFEDLDIPQESPTNRHLKTEYEQPSTPTGPGEPPNRITSDERSAPPSSARRESKTQTS